MKYIKFSLSNKNKYNIFKICDLSIATQYISHHTCRSSRFTCGEYHPMKELQIKKKIEGTFTENGHSIVNRLICLHYGIRITTNLLRDKNDAEYTLLSFTN